MRAWMVTLLLCANIIVPCYATTTSQSLDDVKAIATRYLLNEIGHSDVGEVQIELGRLDPRLQLAACKPELLSAYLPAGHSLHNTNLVGVRCDDVKPWSIYIPVRVVIAAPVLVAQTTLVPGTQIEASHLSLANIDVNRLNHGYFQQSHQLLGKVIKRQVNPGKAITPYDIKSAKVVKRGERVTIRLDKQGMNISMAGEALEAGSLGEIIKIRNLSSNRIIEAKVTGEQQVQVMM